MRRRVFRITFRMTAAEFERFDRVRRAQRGSFRNWTDFIIDALKAYVEKMEASNPGRFPPAVTPPSLIDHFRQHIRERPTPLPAEAPCPTCDRVSDNTSKKQSAAAAAKKKRSPVTK